MDFEWYDSELELWDMLKIIMLLVNVQALNRIMLDVLGEWWGKAF